MQEHTPKARQEDAEESKECFAGTHTGSMDLRGGHRNYKILACYGL